MRWARAALSVNTRLLVCRKKIGRECIVQKGNLQKRRRGVEREEEKGFGKYLRSVWFSMKARPGLQVKFRSTNNQKALSFLSENGGVQHITNAFLGREQCLIPTKVYIIGIDACLFFKLWTSFYIKLCAFNHIPVFTSARWPTFLQVHMLGFRWNPEGCLRCVKIMSLWRLKRSIENWVFFGHLFILFSLFSNLSLSLSLSLSLVRIPSHVWCLGLSATFCDHARTRT